MAAARGRKCCVPHRHKKPLLPPVDAFRPLFYVRLSGLWGSPPVHFQSSTVIRVSPCTVPRAANIANTVVAAAL
ncbi:hypothetical protein E2C01_051490 [Portunus trituberculatus]|uniref:Uncharacterized protein n=1 Tax=Portunus trituberculatus TaxID=210409 RepID=A0A5B7GJ18_PORTR|nr:hypothetical protein [Portunus trituberculatus]